MINYFSTGYLRFWDLFDRCNKWKRLYLEEKKKYEDLKKWTEELLKSNTELLDKFVREKVGYIKVKNN